MRRLGSALGPRRDNEPDVVYGEAHPLPPEQQGQPRPVRLSLPMAQPRAFLVLLVINLLVFFVPLLLSTIGVRATVNIDGQQVRAPIDQIIQFLGAKDNAAIREQGQYYRFLTAMFLHGGLLHIAFNGFALYSIGPEAERIYGTGRFLALYLIAGLAGGLASYTFSPNLSVGASGAIFGLIGGLAIFYYVSRRTLGSLARQQLGSLVTVIMLNLFIGFSGQNIDNWAHIGGLLGGAAVGWFLAPRFEVDSRLYPPVMVRRSLPIAWPGALGLLVLTVVAIAVVNPPLP